LKDSTPMFNLFVRFRKDDELQAVINALYRTCAR
jgi:hypothetical protein